MFQLHSQLAADTFKLGQTELCDVLLMNDANYPWIILVPRRINVREVYALSEADQQIVARDSMEVGECLMDHFTGEKLNTAALGNMVPQLHIHHIVRYSSDSAWPKPVWGVHPAKAYTQKASRLLIKQLQNLFEQELSRFTPC